MFIQMVTGRCSAHEDMHRVVDAWCDGMSATDGWLGGTYGFTDEGNFIGVVRFTSAEAYEACCREEFAADCWAAALDCFEETPEVHGSEDTSVMISEAGDGAEFVQVIRGRAIDPDRLRRMVTDAEMTSMLREARPDIMGATLFIEEDGSFTETVCFTSEAAARLGEQLEMPAEVAADFEASMADASYADLHTPWHARHP